MQYEAQKFIKSFPNKLTKIQANEVSVAFGFEPSSSRQFREKRTIKTRNQKQKLSLGKFKNS